MNLALFDFMMAEHHAEARRNGSTPLGVRWQSEAPTPLCHRRTAEKERADFEQAKPIPKAAWRAEALPAALQIPR